VIDASCGGGLLLIVPTGITRPSRRQGVIWRMRFWARSGEWRHRCARWRI